MEVFIILLPINAKSGPRPVAIFVNGDQNCCAENMSKTRRALSNLGMKVDYSAWNSITAHNMGSNPRNTQSFTISAIRYFDSLPQGTEVYLIGHSFGGDSILQLLGSYRRAHVKFRLVAILDAVGYSGRRDITKQNSVPSNVDYFFNRRQTNAPWPVDINSSGKIECHAKTCDQKEQSFSRAPDGKTRTKECTRVEACPGAGIRTGSNGLPFYYSGVKKTRLHHITPKTMPW